MPISPFGNNLNNFFLAPRNHAVLLKAGAELRPAMVRQVKSRVTRMIAAFQKAI